MRVIWATKARHLQSPESMTWLARANVYRCPLLRNGGIVNLSVADTSGWFGAAVGCNKLRQPALTKAHLEGGRHV